MASAWLIFFVGVALVSAGSAYYHWSPSNPTLVWDRLPMTLGFMAFFAVIIGVIGCFEGMRVEGSAESVGRLTTTSVVLSIFFVIVADAIFSIFFAELGV